VAKDSGTLCFIEVKGRRGTAFGHPAEAVTLEKQRRIFRSAETYLMRRRLGGVPCRFDVVTILGADASPQVSILRDAFPGPARARSRRERAGGRSAANRMLRSLLFAENSWPNQISRIHLPARVVQGRFRFFWSGFRPYRLGSAVHIASSLWTFRRERKPES